MLKKKINKKLKSQEGTSIFFGLLLFLVASVVSVVILDGAVTAMKRVESDRKAEQNYLTCSSAAKLLRDAIENSSVRWEEKVTTDGTKSETKTSWSGATKGSDTKDKFAEFLKNYIEDYSAKSELIPKYTKTFTISVPSDLTGKEEELGEVTAVMEIKKSESDSGTSDTGFDIIVLLTVGSGSDTCQMNLSLSGNADTKRNETTGTGSATINYTYITYTWETADIFYGKEGRRVTE